MKYTNAPIINIANGMYNFKIAAQTINTKNAIITNTLFKIFIFIILSP